MVSINKNLSAKNILTLTFLQNVSGMQVFWTDIVKKLELIWDSGKTNNLFSKTNGCISLIRKSASFFLLAKTNGNLRCCVGFGNQTGQCMIFMLGQPGVYIQGKLKPAKSKEGGLLSHLGRLSERKGECTPEKDWTRYYSRVLIF